MSVIDPVTADKATLIKVKLHPLLDTDICLQLLKLDVVRGSLSLTSSEDIESHYSDPATAPPMNNLRLITCIHPDPITVVNPSGVTVDDVLTTLHTCLMRKLPHTLWNSWSHSKQSTIAECYRYNRKYATMPDAKRGVLFADLLGRYTLFGGLINPHQLEPEVRQKIEESKWPGTLLVQWEDSGHQMHWPASWECP